jgi:hypothetical protein
VRHTGDLDAVVMRTVIAFLRAALMSVVVLSVDVARLRAQGGATSAPSRLIGTVLVDSTERPVANASVSIPALKLTTRSDSVGYFTLGGISAGRHVVVVRAVGYTEFTSPIVFEAGQQLEADLLLRPAAQSLAKVDVTATRSTSGNNPRIAEFDERRKMGFGTFLTQDVFEKADGRKFDDVLVQRITGIRTLNAGGNRYLVSTRGSITMSTQKPCPVQVIIDDIVQNSSTSQKPARSATDVPPDAFEINTIDPDRIAAVEFYTVANRPAQFNRGGAPCGTLVIWTRW